jgi:hypothetical protein
VLTLGAAAAYAGVPPDATCKDKKAKEAGKYTLGIAKAFGSNIKTPNTSKLATSLSKAQSKITKGFTKAEFSGTGTSLGCDTIEDVDDIEDKANTLVDDVLDELEGAPTCPTLNFVTAFPGGSCGRINDDAAGTGTDLTPYGGGAAQLDCGTLYIGGGGSVQPPSPTPDGSANNLKVTDCSVSSAYVLGAATSTDTGSNLNCSAPACKFGPPLPIGNPGATSVSTCVLNVIAASPAVSGTLNATTGAATQTLPLTVSVQVTGDLEAAPGIQPCPTCSGTCNSGTNAGGTCATTTSLLTSYDCPASNATLAPFGVDLSPLTTGTSTMSAAGGVFCPGPPVQRTAGCMGNPTCEYIEENGSPAGDLTAGPALASTLASTFCIAKTGSALVNTVADLPGPGAVTLKGSADLVP